MEPFDCSASANGKAVSLHTHTCMDTLQCDWLVQIPGHVEGITFESLGARYILVVEKDAVFTYLCGQRLWDSLPCILVTGCGYPALSVRALVRSLSTQLALPVLGLFDYNPHGVQILLTYKLGSVRMGLEGHAYTVDLQWLGLHHQDIVEGEEEGGRLKVEQSALQQWSAADERVFAAVRSRVESTLGPAYCREMVLMGRLRVKAEIEAINSSSTGSRHLDSLENTIVRKIVCKKYF